MRIVVDLQAAQNESRYRGIGRYALAFVKALIRNKGAHEVVVLLSDLFPDALSEVQNALGKERGQCRVCVWSGLGPTELGDQQNIWRKDVSELLREAYLSTLQPDVLILSSLIDSPADSTVVSVGKIAPVYTVAMLYDLIPLMYKQEYLADPAMREWYYERLWQLRRADFWFAISESSRRDGIEKLGLPVARVQNISAALGEDIRPSAITPENSEALRRKFGITRAFLLYTGAFDPRKNVDRLVAAYAAQPEEIKHTHQLVLAGGLNAPRLAHIKRVIVQAGLGATDVIVTQRITDEELCALYGLCKAYVLPTYCEGFGFTALEAMACAAPTIGSNYSSVPEVIGLSEALFDPFSVHSIAQKVTQVLTDAEFRERLVVHGRQQVKRFSWDQTALSALAVLTRLEREGVVGARSARWTTPELVKAVTSRIALLKQTSQRSAVELKEVATLVAALLPRQDARPRLFVDITELHASDSKSGIQRVVRSVIQQLLCDGASPYKVELVYASAPLGYKTAAAFTQKLLLQGRDTHSQIAERYRHVTAAGRSDGAVPDVLHAAQTQAAEPVAAAFDVDTWIHPRQGDVFLGLDLHFNIDQDHEQFFAQARRAGAQVHFVVYDLLPLLLKDAFNPALVEKYANWLRVVSQQNGAVCISQAVAAELKDWVIQHQPLAVQTLHIDWFHLGADIENSLPSSGIPEGAAEFLQQLAVQPSFLMVGTLEPRKRHAQVLDAFEYLWGQGLAVHLVIVGKPGWLTDAFTARLSSHPQLDRQLFWIQSASDEYLEKIYAAAKCLIAASEAEGFGLPLIEAARHGLPIIARDIPVFREVAQDHALYFSDQEGRSLVTTIQTWLTIAQQQKTLDSSLIQRKTWAQSTQQLLSRVILNNGETKIA